MWYILSHDPQAFAAWVDEIQTVAMLQNVLIQGPLIGLVIRRHYVFLKQSPFFNLLVQSLKGNLQNPLTKQA